jgi:hypothetical protein
MQRHSSCFAFACYNFSFSFPSGELQCLKVVKLVLVSLVVNYIVDLMMCVIICRLNYIHVYCAKTCSSKKTLMLTDEYKRLYSLVSR